MRNRLLVFLLIAAPARAQESGLKQILDRLSRLEEQNRALAAEVHALREELGRRSGPPADEPEPPAPAEAPPLADRVAVTESRVAELAHAKVESDHRVPLKITGMLLFNAFTNGRFSGDSGNPAAAAPGTGPAVEGATLRQSIFGLKFDGPEVVGGGKVSGSLYLDFFGGTGTPLNQLARIRVATLDLGWKNTTLTAGQDKPIISPREPNSLAQVGISPLTGAGNLWLWQPQARIEQRFHFGSDGGVRAQAGLFQTAEGANAYPAEYRASLGRARPGYEARLEFWRRLGDNAAIEIAPGIHASSTHVNGLSIPSRVYSVDWSIRPFARVDFTGMYFAGRNIATLGSLRQGVTVFAHDRFQPIGAYGGWAQVSLRATRRLTFNLYGGQEDDRNRDLLPGNMSKNQVYAGNAMYRLGPSVVVSFEHSYTRTGYLGAPTLLNRHYDLALAYLF